MVLLHCYGDGLQNMTSMAWSPDGRYLAASTTDFNGFGDVLIWDRKYETPYRGAEHETVAYHYQGHQGPVYAIAWSPDGKKIASAGEDGAVHVWQAPQGDWLPPAAPEVFLSRPQIRVLSLGWSPDSTYLAVVGHHISAKLLPDGSFANDRIYVWKVDPDPVVSLYRPGSNPEWFVDTEYGRNFKYLAMVAWSPGGTHLASLCSGGYGEAAVGIWQSPIAPDTVGGRTQPLFSYAQENCVCMGMAWSPNGNYLAVSSCQQKVDKRFIKLHSMVEIWEWASQRLFCTYAQEQEDESESCEDERPERYGKMVWSPDGSYLASTLLSGTIVVWEALTGKEVYRYSGHESVIGLAWSPDGSAIASLGKIGELQVWNLWEWPKGMRA